MPGSHSQSAICFDYTAKGGFPGKGAFFGKGEFSGKGEVSGKGQFSARDNTSDHSVVETTAVDPSTGNPLV